MRLVIVGLICSVALAPQTKVDWVTQVKNGPVYDVRTYGAKGNGVADDTRAIELTMNAVKAAGGGSVFFPKGTYRYVDTNMSYSAYMHYFTNEGSNVTVFGTGDSSVIQIESPIGQGLTLGYMRNGANVMCDRMDDYPASCNRTTYPGAPPWPEMQRFQPVPQGSKTITLVNSAAGSLFTPGMDVWLHSGENAPYTGHAAQHFEYNVVESVSGGVITLVSALDDSYDLQDPQWPPFITIITVLPKNIVIRDMKITRTTCRPDPAACSDFDGLIINPGGVRNVMFERVTFAGVGPNSAWWVSAMEGLTIKDCIFDNLTSDLGDSGYNITFDHNIWKNIPQRPILVGSSFKNYRVTNNQFTMTGYACCSSAIGFSSTWKPDHRGSKLVITGNTIVMPTNTQYGGGIGVGGATDVLISGNRVIGTGIPTGNSENQGIFVSSSNNVRVTNNMVHLRGTQTVGVTISNNDGPVTDTIVEGNSFDVDRFGINITGADNKATIGCNLTVGGATGINDGATGTVNTCSTGGTGITHYDNGMGSATAAVDNLANHQYCGTFFTPVDLQIGHIVIPINTADASNTLDVGIYGANGVIIAHTGPLSQAWTAGNSWPSKPLCTRNPSLELESCGGAGSPIKTFKIPAGKNFWCYIQGQTQFKMAAYANGAGAGFISDFGLNSSPGNCLPGADGSCSPYVLRPLVGLLAPTYTIGSNPIVILEP